MHGFWENLWEKKVSLFKCLVSVLRSVICGFWMIFWGKTGRKVNDIAGKNLKRVCVLNDNIVEISNTKVKNDIGIFFVIQHMWLFSKSLCNRISTWCAKFENMMHVRAVWKCWILVQKPSKCLNSFAELIYFSETFNILCFAEMLCSESGLMNSLDHNIMAPQNFDPKFHIQKRMLKFCWPKLISGVLQKNL